MPHTIIRRLLLPPLLPLLLLLLSATASEEKSRSEVEAILRASPSERGVPPDFECAWRGLAFDFAAQLQPFRSDGALRAVHDALQLSALCNVTFFGRPPLQPHAPQPQPPPQDEQLSLSSSSSSSSSSSPSSLGSDGGVLLYVDAERGRDDNPGTEAAPLQHLPAAVERARSLSAQARRRTLVLRGGAPHRLVETLTLTSARDSGLHIVAYPGEAPVISSGYPLNTVWSPSSQLRDFLHASHASGGSGGSSGSGGSRSESSNPPSPPPPPTCSPPSSWQVLPGENAMYGNWPSPSIVNASRAPSVAACQIVCGSSPACTSFIYYAQDGGYGPPWDGMCFYRTDGVWTLVSESNITSGRCIQPPNVWVANLSAAGTPLSPSLTAEDSSVLTLLVTTSAGAAPAMRAIRARFPNCDPELCIWPAGWQSGGEWTPPSFNENTTVVSVPFPRNYGPGMFSDYYIGFARDEDGPAACLALGEGDGPAGEEGGARGCYWCQPHGRVSGRAYFLRQPTALLLDSPQLPNAPYADAPANGAVLHYWRPSHWYSAFARVESAVTNITSNATLLGWTYGGFHGAEGTDVGEDWFIDHVKEELDAPREFYFESESQLLFYVHNASAGTPPPASWTFEVPLLTCLINVSGTPESPISDVALSGLIFTGAAPSFMAPHGIPSGGDWAVARTAALTVEGSVGFSVTDSVFTRLDGNAVALNGWNRGANVSRNEFVWLGESAVVSWGRVNGSDATGGEQPWGTTLQGNLCHEIGLYEKQASCYFAALTGGATLVANVFFNMPRAGINFNDDMAGGSRLFHNLVFNTCRESQDHGPFNAPGAACPTRSTSPTAATRGVSSRCPTRSRTISWSPGGARTRAPSTTTTAPPSMMTTTTFRSTAGTRATSTGTRSAASPTSWPSRSSTSPSA